MLKQLFVIELKRIFRDINLLAAIIAPIVIAIVVQSVDTGPLKKPIVGVVGPSDSGLVRALDFGGNLDLTFLKEAEALTLLEQEKIVALLTIPHDFDQELEQGFFPQVTLELDNLYPRQNALVRLCLESAVKDLSLTGEVQVDVFEKNYRDNSGGEHHFLNGLWLCLASLTALSITCLLVVEDKESLLFEALLRGGVSITSLLGGKVLIGCLVGFLSSLIIWSFSENPSQTILILPSALISCGSCAIMGAAIGTFLSSVTTTHMVLSVVNIVFLAPVVLAEVSALFSKWALYSPLWHSYRLFALTGASVVSMSQLAYHFLGLASWGILSLLLIKIFCKNYYSLYL